ncbi:uncharacterized protein CXorf65 homolog [Caloenas nicobarica]|uniref:uncharacterized protein CXorf65 homolog n=1 Tax=Caloenas nicobarica TaxID=187106 RepID=UPI0032B82AB5
MFIHIKHGDDQCLLANTDCAVLRLLSYVRRMVGIPDTDVIDLCDELGTPKMLFQVTSLSERASDFLQPHGTYYLCRVEFKVPGSEEDRTTWSFTPLLKNPSSALTEGLRLQGERRQRRAAGTRRMAEDRRTPDTETLTSTVQSQAEGKASGRDRSRAGTEGARRKVASPARARQGLGQQDTQR